MANAYDIYAQKAYEGYYKKSDGKSLISGAALPLWDDQSDAIKDAWAAGVGAVLEQFIEDSASWGLLARQKFELD